MKRLVDAISSLAALMALVWPVSLSPQTARLQGMPRKLDALS